MSSKADYIIIGQGISGTFLSYYLHKAGKNILVFDEPKNNTASKVTSGVINPVTGRRIVRTWMIEEIMPFAAHAYQALENELNISLIHQCNILDFHPTAQMQNAFDERVNEETYLSNVKDTESWRNYFNYDFGIGEINPCWQINIQALIQEWRKELQKNNQLIEEKFSVEQIKDYADSKIIFCDGVANIDNTFFHLLPYAANKGEALIVEIKDLPRTNMYKQSCAIVPWKDDLWWIGSNYEWNFENDLPSKEFRESMEQKLKSFLKLPYKIITHIAALRPANVERRPFVGLHPTHKNIGILNGMGTKGCSLAPYFAHQLAENLMNNKPILAYADIQRFKGILSKQ
ncbi:MAG: FAD-binding oxidoreductase [Chitinophagaceae bacterium]|nr:FAD-binding oxidoreductase [Chitinophagaceae bacterium]MCW5903993.1 FAD-binding oxidoreductase [Chitinophagaceae bacterium]